MVRTPRHLLICAIFILMLSSGLNARAADGPPPGTPTATSSSGVASVGPLFSAGLAQPHTCTAGVLDSPHGDLLITAAHCVMGSGAGMVFAPGYQQGHAPFGIWTVQRAWALPGWLDHQDPHSDVAILQVADQQLSGGQISLQNMTGGLPLGQTAAPGTPQTVTTVAYPAGLNDLPVTCTAPLGSTLGYPPSPAAATPAEPAVAPSCGAPTVTQRWWSASSAVCTRAVALSGTPFPPPLTCPSTGCCPGR